MDEDDLSVAMYSKYTTVFDETGTEIILSPSSTALKMTLFNIADSI